MTERRPRKAETLKNTSADIVRAAAVIVTVCGTGMLLLLTAVAQSDGFAVGLVLFAAPSWFLGGCLYVASRVLRGRTD
jgi:amino acid permease